MINQINEFILSKGYSFKIGVGDLDGKYHEERGGDDKVWFIGSVDGEHFTFTFGDWKNSDEKHFFSSSGNIPEEKIESIKKETENKKLEQHLLTQSNLKKHYAKWKTLESLPRNKYWQKKKLPLYQGELDTYPLFFKPGDTFNVSILVCPMVDINGEIWNAQYIAEDGTKTFQPGGKIEGCFFPIGIAPEALHNYAPINRTIYVGEGLATCFSFHKMTQSPVLTAFSSSNIKHVVKALLDIGVPSQCVAVLADWDGGNVQNTGMIEAQKCAEEFGTLTVAPIWPDCDLDVNRDFSDIYVSKLHETQTCHKMLPPKYFLENDFIGKAKEERKRLKSEKAAQSSQIDPEDPPKTTVNHEDVSVWDVRPTENLPSYHRLSKNLLKDLEGKRVLSTIENFKAILDACGVVVRYNIIKKDQEWFINGETTSFDNQKNVIHARIMDLCRRVGMPVTEIKNYLTYLCDQNQFNPVMVWITSKKWDGVKRFDEFAKTIVADEDEELKNILLKKWMIGAVAAVNLPFGIQAPGVLVLQGFQGIGKTKWFNSLVPKDLGLIADGKMLRPDDKDSVKQTICYWLVELGELDSTFKKSDISQLKAFLTRDKDQFRPAFAPHECNFARRTLFFGSVNQKEFLADMTGNRRYWTVSCSSINYEHDFDMQQIWAEVAELYKNGEKWWLTDEEMKRLNQSNESFSSIDPIEELLLEKYDWSRPEGDTTWKRCTASEVLRELGIDRPSKAELNNCAVWIRKLNKNRVAKKINGRKVLWVAPKFDAVGKMLGGVENLEISY